MISTLVRMAKKPVMFLGPAAVLGVVLAAGQVFVTDLLGINDLGAVFEAGNERIEGVAPTLVAWLCALSVMVPVAAIRADSVPGRALGAVGAAAGALVAFPVATALADEAIEGVVQRAVLIGIGLGLVVALIGAFVAPLYRGVWVHAAVWWILAMVALLGRSVEYPGLVELLDFQAARETLTDVLPSGRITSYHLPYLLPSILATVIAGAVVAVLARRQKAGRAAAAAGGAGGALLATAAFFALPDQLTGWNGEAAVLAAGTAALTLLVAALSTLGGARTEQRSSSRSSRSSARSSTRASSRPKRR
jgi:hypothetical protein